MKNESNFSGPWPKWHRPYKNCPDCGGAGRCRVCGESRSGEPNGDLGQKGNFGGRLIMKTASNYLSACGVGVCCGVAFVAIACAGSPGIALAVFAVAGVAFAVRTWRNV